MKLTISFFYIQPSIWCVIFLLTALPCYPEDKAQIEETSISSRLTWYRLRELQTLRSTELAFKSLHSFTASEKGWKHTVGKRFQTRADVSIIAKLNQIDFSSKTTSDNENLTSIELSVSKNYLNDELFFHFETGHKTQPGFSINWNKTIKPGAYFGLETGRSFQDSALNSLKYCESSDYFKGQFALELPTELFFISESNFYRSRLECPDKDRGNGYSHIAIIGFRLTHNSRRKMKGFYEQTLRYPDNWKKNIYFALSQKYQRFKAGASYFSKISPATKSYEQKAIFEATLPLTPHIGYQFNSYIGQDLARDLQFAKIKGVKNTIKWMPTHRAQYQLQYNYSTENIGSVKGDLSEIIITIHANI